MTQNVPPVVVIGRAPGPELHLLPVGATVQRLVVTCGDGVRRDVALGLADGDAVRASTDYVGSVVGRYANRIAHGRWSLDGEKHEVPGNDRGHHLHGGPDGFHTRTWDVVEPRLFDFEIWVETATDDNAEDLRRMGHELHGRLQALREAVRKA